MSVRPDTVDEVAIARYLSLTCPGVETSAAMGYTFFFYGADRKLPFATIATADNDYDRASHLNRPNVYRLNVGVGRDTYRSLFGPLPPPPGAAGVVDTGHTGHDFSVLDRLMPHPIYAPQSWVCVLCPSEQTFEKVKPLLAEAFQRAVVRRERAAGGGDAEEE
jgi:hypothetical protein